MPIVGDFEGIIAGMLEVLEKDGATLRDDQWIADIEQMARRYPFYHPNMAERGDEIVPELVIAELGRQLDPRPPSSPPRWASTRWAHQFSTGRFRAPSSPQGARHHGLRFPAAIGPRWRDRCHAWSASPATGRSDELPGNGHGRHQRRAREGHDPGQPLPRHGPPMAEAVLRRALFSDASLRPYPTS